MKLHANFSLKKILLLEITFGFMEDGILLTFLVAYLLFQLQAF